MYYYSIRIQLYSCTAVQLYRRSTIFQKVTVVGPSRFKKFQKLCQLNFLARCTVFSGTRPFFWIFVPLRHLCWKSHSGLGIKAYLSTWYRVPPILSLYRLRIGLVYCNPIPNLLNAAKWPFLFLLWPNGHSYSFCGLLAIPFLGYLSTIAFPTK